jgi:hypothetical protein
MWYNVHVRREGMVLPPSTKEKEMKKPEWPQCKVHKEVHYTLTLTSDINRGSKNTYTGRLAGDVLHGMAPNDGRRGSPEDFRWLAGHNETSTVSIAGHVLKKVTTTTTTTVVEEEEVIK